MYENNDIEAINETGEQMILASITLLPFQWFIISEKLFEKIVIENFEENFEMITDEALR